jgi:hypothetical protein
MKAGEICLRIESTEGYFREAKIVSYSGLVHKLEHSYRPHVSRYTPIAIGKIPFV